MTHSQHRCIIFGNTASAISPPPPPPTCNRSFWKFHKNPAKTYKNVKISSKAINHWWGLITGGAFENVTLALKPSADTQNIKSVIFTQFFLPTERSSWKQECIPVGCVPPAAVAVSGGSPPGTHPPGSRHSPRRRHPPPGAGTPRSRPPLWTESQTLVKI